MPGALIKGRVSEADSKALTSPAFNLRDLKPLRTINLWMKAPPSTATSPDGNGIKDSEDKGYVLYVTRLDAAFPVVQAVLDSGKIQIGFLVQGNKTEQVMFGVVNLSNEEKEQLTNCLGEFSSPK